jgi:hypothetical protein
MLHKNLAKRVKFFIEEEMGKHVNHVLRKYATRQESIKPPLSQL